MIFFKICRNALELVISLVFSARYPDVLDICNGRDATIQPSALNNVGLLVAYFAAIV
jgi:hypothetical protein